MIKSYNFSTREEAFDIAIKAVVDKFIETKSHYQIVNVESKGKFKGEVLFLLLAKVDNDEKEFNVLICPTPEIPNEYIDGLVEAFEKSGAISDIILNGNKFCNISKRPLSDWLDAINNNINNLDMPYIKFAA